MVEAKPEPTDSQNPPPAASGAAAGGGAENKEETATAILRQKKCECWREGSARRRACTPAPFAVPRWIFARCFLRTAS